MSTETRALEMACGGRVLLEVEADWLHMSDADLAFVRGLARAIDNHRAGVAEAPLPPASSPSAPALHPDDVECPDCGQVCTTTGGLAVHQARTHGKVNRNSLDRYYTGTARDGRSRPWRCHCGVTGKGGGGLRSHIESHERQPAIGGLAAPGRPPASVDDEREAVIDLVAAVEPTEAELAEVMADRAIRGHRFDGAHRSVKEDTAHGGKRVYCECGWVTLPFDERLDAREAFAAHLDEMSAARQGVA